MTGADGSKFTRGDSGITVDEPTESSLRINGYVLTKNGNKLTGEIGQTKAFTNVSSLTIDASWKKKGGYYKIEGSFGAIAQPDNFYGTFRMESY